MTKTENERLARMEGKLDTMFEHIKETNTRFDKYHGEHFDNTKTLMAFRTRVKATVATITTILATVLAILKVVW